MPHSVVFRRSAAVALVAISLALLAGCATGGSQRTGRGSNEPTAHQRAAETNLRLGQAYMQQGQLELALDKLRKALELDPESAQAHTVLALLLERIGRPDQAGNHYRRSVELAPAAGGMLNNYGAYLCRHGRYAEADAQFRLALEDPFYRTPGAALGNAGVCAAQAGDNETAEQYFRRLLEYDPANATALFQLARIQYGKGEFLRARGFMQRFESAGPATPEALQLAAAIEDKLGNVRSAGQYRERLKNEFPDYTPQGETPQNPSGETHSP